MTCTITRCDDTTQIYLTQECRAVLPEGTSLILCVNIALAMAEYMGYKITFFEVAE